MKTMNTLTHAAIGLVLATVLTSMTPAAPVSGSAPLTPRAGQCEADRALSQTPFFQLEVRRASALPVQDLRGNEVYERLEQIDQEEGDVAYRAALVEELSNHGPDDPLTGYIHTNLGIMDLMAEDFDSAMNHVLPVANGEIASAACHRVMAMIRVAWLTHQHLGDRLGAYQAYREIERFTGMESVRVRCQVECAGLLMELARHDGVGTLADCRRACDQVLTAHGSDRSDLIRNRVATAALMRAETFYYEDNRPAAIEALTDVAETYLDRMRESSMALYFLAHTLRREGRSEDAINIFQNLADMELRAGETFSRQDLNQKARRDLILTLIESERIQEAERHLSEFIRSNPEPRHLDRLAERLGEAPQLSAESRALLRQHRQGPQVE